MSCDSWIIPSYWYFKHEICITILRQRLCGLEHAVLVLSCSLPLLLSSLLPFCLHLILFYLPLFPLCSPSPLHRSLRLSPSYPLLLPTFLLFITSFSLLPLPSSKLYLPSLSPFPPSFLPSSSSSSCFLSPLPPSFTTPLISVLFPFLLAPL